MWNSRFLNGDAVTRAFHQQSDRPPPEGVGHNGATNGILTGLHVTDYCPLTGHCLKRQ